MALGPTDLVLCSGTLPPGTPFADRLAAAAGAGCSAVSLWGRDVAAARAEGRTDAELAAMVADHGLAVAELDPVWWWTPGAPAESPIPPELDPLDVFCFGERDLFAMGEALGARSLNAADVLGGPWGVEEAAEAFAALCDRAAEHGLLVHLEWLAWSRIPDLATAAAVVALADRDNGGLTIDAWHVARAGVEPAEVAALPGGRILSVQLDDGPAAPEENLVHATLHDRLLPGAGDFDLAGLVRALVDAGAGCPVGIEVFSDDLHARGVEAAARDAVAATRAVLSAGGWPW